MDPKEVEIPGNSEPNQPGARISHLALDIGGDSLSPSISIQFNSREFLVLLCNCMYLCI